MTKTRKRKYLYTALAITLALVLGIGAILSTVRDVQASVDMMPGIEKIVSENKIFKILELVNQLDEAEIGWYVSGQELYLTYKGKKYSSLEEGLKSLKSAEDRKAFTEAYKDKLIEKGVLYTKDQKDKAEKYPVGLVDYQEKYFLTKEDKKEEWTRLDFARRTVTLKGQYKLNHTGEGDYTKGEGEYNPIKKGEDDTSSDSQKKLYRENIEKFAYSDNNKQSAPYNLSFEAVDNTTINQNLKNGVKDNKEIAKAYDYESGQYGYYENVYEKLTAAMADSMNTAAFAGENAEDDSTLPVISEPMEGDFDISMQTAMTPTIMNLYGGEVVANTEIKNSDTAGTNQNPYIYIAEKIDDFPKLKYTMVGDFAYVKEKAKNLKNDIPKAGDIFIEDGSYYYYQEKEDGKFEKKELYLVTHRQNVSINELKELPENLSYAYYYRVSKCEFAYEGTGYKGWYHASYSGGKLEYQPVDAADADSLLKPATHYTIEQGYKLTPGIGDYDFVEGKGVDDREYQVTINHLFYRGGYSNNDWLKRDVFHLDPDSKDETVKEQFKSFHIKVDTKVIDSKKEEGINFEDYNLIYINGKLASKMASQIKTQADSDKKMPVIINETTALADGDTAVKEAFAEYVNGNLEGDAKKDFVNRCVYFTSDGILNPNFHAEMKNKSDFSEISKYIEDENAYRKVIDNASTGGSKAPDLKSNISQARVLEYIINYQYKRKINTKGEYHILDIEPASPTASIGETEVKNWLGISKMERIDVCCEEKEDYLISNAIDGKLDTFWESDPNVKTNIWTGKLKNHSGDYHFFTYYLKESDTELTGFRFAARPEGDKKGVPTQLKVTVQMKNGKTISKTFKEGTDFNSNKYYEPQQFNFDEGMTGATSIKVEYVKSYENKVSKSTKYAACSFFEPIYKDDVKIKITTMTSSEFVGHIDDITTKYDLIYFGDGTNCWNQYRNGKTENKNLYASIGADYSGKHGDTKGSGNDITKQQVKELQDFIASGYPIVIGDELLKNQKVNTDVVDSKSCMYTFLSQALVDKKSGKRSNVKIRQEANQEQNLAFFFYLPKPEIEFEAMPPEPTRANTKAEKFNEEAKLGYLTGDTMTWKFKIKNDAEISMASATYDCELFFDLNFDGNLSNKEEQSKYIKIVDSEGKAQKRTDGKYHLKLGETYTLTRKVPKDYYKMITWKVQVSNNANDSIRSSTLGFAKRKAEKKQEMKVLQIQPNKNNDKTWKITSDNDLTKMLNQVEEFQFSIRSDMTVSGYETMIKTNPASLDTYDIIILGFGKEDLSKEGAAAIDEFIKTGKSVIFTHDIVNDSNKELRESSGMDRYGVTKGETSQSQGISNNYLIKDKEKELYTKEVTKVNEGVITQYPYQIGDTLTISETHSQFYQLAMEGDDDEDGKNDIVVWYCLGGDNELYEDSPNDARNSYYCYSKGNVIYAGMGHTGKKVIGGVTEQERQLFVNTLVAAAEATALAPEIEFLQEFDPDANVEEFHYYVTDTWNAENDGSTLVSKDSEFRLFVRDYNIVASRLDEEKDKKDLLKLELYMDDENGNQITVNGEKVKATKLKHDDLSDLTLYPEEDKKTIKAKTGKGNQEGEKDDGTFELEENATVRFTIPTLETYLKDSTGTYKKNCHIYAKVTSQVYRYGKLNEKTAWTVLELRQRHVFDMN